jgi:hypothetical protein
MYINDIPVRVGKLLSEKGEASGEESGEGLLRGRRGEEHRALGFIWLSCQLKGALTTPYYIDVLV